MTSFRSFALLALLPAAAHAQQSFFGGIGDLAGGQTISYANRLSANGLVVVGESYNAQGLQAITYTRADGMKVLPRLTNNFNLQGHRATSVSADGSMIAGYTSGQAVYWKNGGPATPIQDLAGGSVTTYAYAVSGDGKSIGGSATTGQGSGAARWNAPGYGVENLGDLPGGFSYLGAVSDINADGRVLVGNSSSSLSVSQGNFTEFREAFRIKNGNMQGLGDLAGGRPYSAASAVSADGETVVGFGSVGISNLGSFRHAFRWTEATGMVDLGSLGGRISEAYAISSDATWIGGLASEASAPDAAMAALWNEKTGWLSAQSFFTDAGIDLTGWNLLAVSGVQKVDSLLYVSGWGWHNGNAEGFYAGVDLAPVPEPTAFVALTVGALAAYRRKRA